MKIWIRTKIVGAGTEEDARSPYIANQNVPSSMMELLNDECLCRVAGTAVQIATILVDTSITEQTDEQAESTIHTKHPDSNLENLDIADPEIDTIAESQGLDPHSRADIQTASRGNQLLQDQENYLLAMISAKKGKSKKFWDDEAGKSGKYLNGIDIENAILDGKGAAHEFMLSRLR
ncbi:hypothetical protein KAW18_08110 [candidate division WOR-3 bacterium]|nr:hypothetical protein [candidate division WOR-3 bacterium]